MLSDRIQILGEILGGIDVSSHDLIKNQKYLSGDKGDKFMFQYVSKSSSNSQYTSQTLIMHNPIISWFNPPMTF